LVRVRLADLELDLVTNLVSLSAEQIALIYRHRWQVEVFFKWLKCILGCEHWLAESPQGVAIQVYCALIASVLLALWSGRRPNKRAMEALRFYQLGLADDEELELLLYRAKML
jgi:IS4 transposase